MVISGDRVDRTGPASPAPDRPDGSDQHPRAILDKSPNRLVSSARRLVIEATYSL
jgi:hypothetical protein